MPEDHNPDAVVAWNASVLFDKLERKMDKRFDSQDALLVEIDRRLDNTASTQDISELHSEVTAVKQRVRGLEVKTAADAAVASARARFRNRLWLGTAGVVVPLTCALIFVLVQ